MSAEEKLRARERGGAARADAICMSIAGLHARLVTAEFEDLEVRRMMASVTMEDGILIVRGDMAKPNHITVTASKGKIQAAAGRAKLAVAAAAVLAIRIEGGVKADVIDVRPLVKLGAYIDSRGGNDTIRTGGGNDTVVGGAGNDKIVNRGGADAIYGGAGTNTVKAKKRDTVYAGLGKSKVKGATNRSLADNNPVIPLPPTSPKPEVPNEQDGTDETNEQPPVVKPVQQQEDPPVVPPVQQQEDPPPVTTDDDVVPLVTDSQPPATQEPDGLDSGGVQEPGGLNPGGQSPQDPTVLVPEEPQPVVTWGPTVNARDFGAKLDGTTDDLNAIQAALDALPVTGGTLVIDGVAAIGFKGLTVRGKDHITIKGTSVGDGFVVLPGTAAKSTWNFWKAAVLLTDCTNSTVTGLTIDAAGNIGVGICLERCTDTKVTGNTVVHTAGGTGAIGSTGGLRNTFSYNKVLDTYDTCRGMWIGNVHEGEMENSPLIEHNVILRCSATGIGGHHAGAVIRNNEVRDCRGAGIALGGYDKNAGYDAVTKDCLVENNVLTGNDFHGIQSDVTGESTFTTRVRVVGNLCEGNGNTGIFACRVSDWVIESNICRNNRNSGISLVRAIDTVVRGNTCESTGAAGTMVQQVGIDAVSNGAVLGTSADTAAGNRQTLRNLVIDKNVCKGNALAGIKLGSLNDGTADLIRITNNTCSGNTWDGIYVRTTAVGVLTNVTVLENTCVGNGRIDLNVGL